MSTTGSGPWTEILEKELKDSRRSQDPLPLQTIPLQKKISSQFLKFELISWWGIGGGLLYFDVQRNGEEKIFRNVFFINWLIWIYKMLSLFYTHSCLICFMYFEVSNCCPLNHYCPCIISNECLGFQIVIAILATFVKWRLNAFGLLSSTSVKFWSIFWPFKKLSLFFYFR